MSVIYKPKGRAAEYSLLACNLFTGCVHGCEYCYAPKTLHITPEQFRANVKPRQGIIDKLRREAYEHRGTDKRVLLCFSCDPYQPEEIEQGITREALKILRAFDIPFQVLTKGGVRAYRDFDLYGPNDVFAETFVFANEEQILRIEPKTALWGDRFRALEYAKEEGITTWVSLEPVIDASQTLANLESLRFEVDLFKIGKLNYQKTDINWRNFGINAIKLCEKYGKPYYIKDDLAKYLEGIKFTNSDTRKIQR
jgi:DNA repair photolyase